VAGVEWGCFGVGDEAARAQDVLGQLELGWRLAGAWMPPVVAGPDRPGVAPGRVAGVCWFGPFMCWPLPRFRRDR